MKIESHIIFNINRALKLQIITKVHSKRTIEDLMAFRNLDVKNITKTY